MKVTAFNGSPRRGGNTEILLRRLMDDLSTAGMDCEFVQLGGQLVHGCTACMKCRENQNKKCVFTDDPMNSWIEKMIDSDIILIGSPTYFASLTSETKALIDRAGYVCRGNGNALKRKIGAAVVSVRRAGALNVFQGINNFFLINEMIVPGSSYWNLAVGKAPGDVTKDEEGMATMDVLAKQIIWLADKISA
ncbi:MAG: flavodoxin family protein [Spirochaetales bacterium]|nr:flavodoxin family protein [Spirochaetales bacterium]